ncbi:hypothetical protein [uncultured Tenacibaculum sp.]|uniref:hypothetical protein n=1 Tax=uncultured Tenacibaculum sp. TaxID=174713 RepID=UPI002610AAEA|nr:hypothetical protein [uncultured Tenacibaculum sp.]
MLKNISKLGTTLNKSEQQSINGGYMKPNCDWAGPTRSCPPGYYYESSTNCCYES